MIYVDIENEISTYSSANKGVWTKNSNIINAVSNELGLSEEEKEHCEQVVFIDLKKKAIAAAMTKETDKARIAAMKLEYDKLDTIQNEHKEMIKEKWPAIDNAITEHKKKGNKKSVSTK